MPFEPSQDQRFRDRVKPKVASDATPPTPKIFDPFEGKTPTPQQAADELARLVLAKDALRKEATDLVNRIAQVQDSIYDLAGPLFTRGVLKSFTTHKVPGGYLTFTGVIPNVDVVFTKEG